MPSSGHATRLGPLVFLFAAATLGCSEAQPGDEPVGQASQAIFGNDQTSFDYFVGKGLSPIQAAGIVGNLDQESGDSPTAVQGGGPGRGVAQWSVGGRWDTSAGDNENAFVGASKIWDLTSQLDFIWYELTTFPGYGLADLKSQTTISGATTAFMDKFEICGTCDATTRISYAQAVYNAYGNVAYAAAFVSQSFPYATTTLSMTAGQVLPSYIELKNTGSATWDKSTRIGTTEPRDRLSAFADGTWIAPNRPATVTGTVAPGGTYKFAFDLAAPLTPGLYDEHFGVVQESVAWFSDPGQGGPPDTDLEVKIQVVATAASSSAASSGGSTSSGGAGGDATGSTGAASGGGGAASGNGAGGASGEGGSSTSGTGTSGGTGQASSCATSPGYGATGRAELWVLALMLAALRLGRRREPDQAS
jgi:MYXO-CTERM domain-containing protein